MHPKVTDIGSPVELLAAMVQFDTVNSNISGKPEAERPLAEFLEALAQHWGLPTRRLEVPGEAFNLLVTHEVDPAAPWLLFDSHLDTVSVAGMSVDPFGAEIRDGRMYGRGAADTKSSGAAMLWALRQYAQGPAGPTNVALALVVGEEFRKPGAIAMAEQHLPALGWRPAGVIVGEPTMLDVVVAHNGVVRWTITTHGRACHSSDPSQGRSAISMMLHVVRALETNYIPQLTAAHRWTGRAQCSVNLIRGGSQINIIPDRCEIEIDRRIVPGEDPEAVLPAVAKVLAEVQRAHPEMAVTQGEPFIDLALDDGPGEAFGLHVQKTLARVRPTQRIGVRYGTDASAYAAVGLPAIVLGPGDIAQAHTHDEWIALEQVDAAVVAYQQIMNTPVSQLVSQGA